MVSMIERFTMPSDVRLAILPSEATPNDGKQVITGYAIKWNSPSQDLGGFRRVFRPGVFSESLQQNEVYALYAHDDNDLVGRESNGTLRLQEDDQGLRYELDPPDYDPKFFRADRRPPC